MRRSTLNFALLGLAVAPAAWSIPVTLADSTVKLDVGVVMQNRAEMNWSETSKGTDFDANRGDTVAADMVDFYNRRARLTVSAEREGWKGLISFSADKADKVGKPERAVELVYLWASKTIKTGDLSHVITVGQDQPNVQPSFRDPSSQLLFPVPRATVLYPAAAIGYGVRYQLNHSLFQVSFDAQNNRDAGRNSVTETNGLFYGLRAVASLLPGVALPKRTESFVGEKGMGLALGLDGTLDHAYTRKGSAKTVPDTSYSTYSGGADVLFHMDALTADADFRMQQLAKPGKHEQSMAISVQAGYAIPVASMGIVVEPALRGSMIDKDVDNKFTDAKAATTYSSAAVAEHGNSGYEGEVGVNIYFKGHSNKLQIGFQRWEAEESNANANILRIQHQFSF
jgi:hypothetical protein